jgi:hypothetical protein
MAEPSPLGRAALIYAGHGWPVFPLVPLRKTPLTARGFHDASTEPDQILDWWTANPRANIGVPTGPDGCGLDVWDADTPGAIERLREGHKHPDAPVMAALSLTPRGMHYWIAATGDPCATSVAPGLDFRGVGGYVVVPPSVSPAGGYLWKLPPWQG